jgi:adenosylcobinamide-GDP ribazoletransferase
MAAMSFGSRISSASKMSSHLRREVRQLLAAVQYFTRVPVPTGVDHAVESLNGAVRYVPMVGILVGAAGAGIYVLAARLLPPRVALLLSMVATMLLTGAFHEDGLADSADGFGGGSTPERALEIMKDARIGAFGALALALALLLKLESLVALPAGRIAGALVAGNALSRLATIGIMVTLPYVREHGISRARPLVTDLSAASLAVAVVTGLAPLLLVGTPAIAGVACACLTTLGWRRYIRRRIGGYSGDCLGAAQQLTELSFYLGLLANSR